MKKTKFLGTMYSNIPMKELIKINKKFKKKYWKLFDESIPFQERKLSRLVADQIKEPALGQLEIDSVRDWILENVYRNLLKFSMEYRANIDNYTLSIFGKELNITQFVETANILFRLMDTEYIICSEESYHSVNFIFGILEELKHEIQYYIMREEFIVFPENICTTGWEYNNTAIIRQVLIEKKFFEFQNYFYKNAIERVVASQNTLSFIQNKFIKIVLDFSGIINIQELICNKNDLIEALKDNEIWRIFGLQISHNDMKMEHYDFKSFLETDKIRFALLEAIGAWAESGTFARFLEIAHTDVKRATRNFYLYLLDNFYYEDRENLSFQSKVVISIALQFIHDDTVNFNGIASKRDEIYSFFRQQCTDLAEKAEAVELELLKMVSNGNESKYHYSLQEYILERAKEIIEKMSYLEKTRGDE